MLTQNYTFLYINNTLKPVCLPIKQEKLIAIDEQYQLAEKNIISFLENSIYLNMLLWGERGCGKSSLIKQLIIKYGEKGLRVVQFVEPNLNELHDLYCKLYVERYKFILLFDDISFDSDDEKYRRFKSILEGGIFDQPENIMFVATSNRRHLIQERAIDTNEIYNRDDINESVSLYSRFGLVIGFYPISKDDYLQITHHYLLKYNLPIYEGWEKDAENFAINRGGRSGRVAKQFALFKKIYG